MDDTDMTPLETLSKLMLQTITLLGQALGAVTYSRRKQALTSLRKAVSKICGRRNKAGGECSLQGRLQEKAREESQRENISLEEYLKSRWKRPVQPQGKPSSS